MGADDLRSQRNQRSDDNTVYEMLMRRRELGIEGAAGQNLRRATAEAEIHERMNNPEEARSAYYDLAAGALARAQMLGRPEDR